MIFYYLLVAVVDVFTAVNEDDWQIAADIREGNISQFLLKPVDYLWYRLCLFFSGRIAFVLMAAVPLAVFIFCFRQYFLPPADAATLVVFPVSLVLTALLQFFISYAMAMLAFWLLEISTFIFILFAFEYLASGHLFPLDMLPPALKAHSLSHAVSVSAVFSHQHLHGQGGRARICGSGWRTQLLWVLAAYGLPASCGGAASKLFGVWRMKLLIGVPSALSVYWASGPRQIIRLCKSSLIEMLFDLIGKLFFPRQQDWERRRSAKIMTAAVTAGLVLGMAMVWLIKHMNSIRK